MRLSKTARAGIACAAAATLLSGCLASSSKTGGSKGANTSTSKTINMIVAFSGPQFAQFKAALNPLVKAQGITVNYASDSNFNADIVNKVKSNQLPDIALFPQPGILAQIAKEGKVADLDSVLDIPSLKSEMVSGILDPGTTNGKVYGIPPSINVKSLVFYPKKAWAKDGLTPPTTLADLLTFSAKLKSEGKTPWCMGIGADTATGWPATDWVEQLILNMYGTTVYNEWVTHKITFSSPQIRGAFTYFQKIFSTPGWVYGGQKAIAGTAFGTAGNPMFNANNTESNPGCYMFKQGNFITQSGFFPTAILKQTDANIGAFFFPGKTAGDHPVEGGGDLAALFSGGNKYAIEVMKDMLNKNFADQAAKTGGYISPFKDFPQSSYPDNLTRQMANIAYNATSFSFDGSDNMPGAVGSGSFWKDMTAWISGSTSLTSALSDIDSTWPKS